MRKTIAFIVPIAAMIFTTVAVSAQEEVSSETTTTTTTTTVFETTSTTTTTTTLADDSVAPRVIATHISKSEVARGETFEVFIEVTDNVEVIYTMAIPRLTTGSPAQYADRYELCVNENNARRAPQLVSGDSRAGVWSMTCTVPSGIETGTYTFMPFALDSSDNKSFVRDTSENPETWVTIQIR